MWVFNHTRPDISCDVSAVSSKLNNATVNELYTMNKLINKVKDNQYKLKYQQLGTPIKIRLFTDVALRNLSDGSSQEDKFYYLQIFMTSVISKLLKV